MANKKKTPKRFNPEDVKITIDYTEFDDVSGLDVKFKPDPLNPNTNLKKLIMVLVHGFDEGIRKLVSVIKELPEPTEEHLKNFEYPFAEYGDETAFALYQYRKGIMDEIASLVDKTITDVFHRELYVRGVQEKIFQQIRDAKLTAPEKETIEETNDETKGGVN